MFTDLALPAHERNPPTPATPTLAPGARPLRLKYLDGPAPSGSPYIRFEARSECGLDVRTARLRVTLLDAQGKLLVSDSLTAVAEKNFPLEAMPVLVAHGAETVISVQGVYSTTMARVEAELEEVEFTNGVRWKPE